MLYIRAFIRYMTCKRYSHSGYYPSTLFMVSFKTQMSSLSFYIFSKRKTPAQHYKDLIPVSECECVCVCGVGGRCGYACGCVRMRTCTRRPEIRLEGRFSEAVHLVFPNGSLIGGGSLLLMRSLLSSIGIANNWTLRDFFVCFVFLLMLVQGMEFRTFGLHRSSLLRYLPRLIFMFFKKVV